METNKKRSGIKWVLGLLVVLNVVVLTLLWLAVIRRPPLGRLPLRPGGRGPEARNFLQRELGLTLEQVKTFDAVRDRFLAEVRPVHEQIFKLKEQVLAEMSKPAPDRAAVEALAVRIGVLRGEEERLLSFHFLDMMNACSADQRPKFQAFLREFMIRIGALEPPGPPRPDRGPSPRPGDNPPFPPR